VFLLQSECVRVHVPFITTWACPHEAVKETHTVHILFLRADQSKLNPIQRKALIRDRPPFTKVD
jgi:hypothetical protein